MCILLWVSKKQIPFIRESMKLRLETLFSLVSVRRRLSVLSWMSCLFEDDGRERDGLPTLPVPALIERALISAIALGKGGGFRESTRPRCCCNHRSSFLRRLFLLICYLGTAHALTGSAQNTVGVTLNTGGAFPGYTLFTPSSDTHAYLVNNAGELANRWISAYLPGFTVYLLPDGRLLRAAQFGNSFAVGGAGGRVELLDWDSTLVWSYNYSTTQHRQHHDAILLPNGNVLMIAWELKTHSEAVAAGRSPALISQNALWPDTLVEVQPVGQTGGNIVWSWHVWDHLIQDIDNSKANYGSVANHPELVDMNFALDGSADWLHVNGLDYNAELNELLVSVHNLSEVWIIDHSTTAAEAAGHSGGLRGRGGDILYRWGNPRAYRAGTTADQELFQQHNPNWIRDGSPGAGHILIFNNGVGRPGGSYSTITEIIPPLEANGTYTLTPGGAYGPSAATWTYTASPPSSFYAQNVSSAQRLPNGNTLIDSGPQGRFFEIDASGQAVWRYVCPLVNGSPLTQGQSPPAQNQVFRAVRYAADYAGLAGHDLTTHGTIELQPNAFFDITDIRPDLHGILLRWNCVRDRDYTVQWCTDLAAGQWGDIETVSTIGTSAFFTDTNAARLAGVVGMYRVRPEPQAPSVVNRVDGGVTWRPKPSVYGLAPSR
jgi:hypothetical protein